MWLVAVPAVAVVILATGFAPALAPLGQLIRVDEKGFAIRDDRITSADHDRLYFVGHNYDTTGSLANIAHDARLAAKRIAAAETGDRGRPPRPNTEHSHTA